MLFSYLKIARAAFATRSDLFFYAKHTPNIDILSKVFAVSDELVIKRNPEDFHLLSQALQNTAMNNKKFNFIIFLLFTEYIFTLVCQHKVLLYKTDNR